MNPVSFIGLNPRWHLQIAGDECFGWSTQYTGFDPPLELPSGITNTLAEEFLRSYARFEDRISEINGGDFRDRPAVIIYDYFKQLAETKSSNRLSEIFKRAWFNLNLLDYMRGGFLRYAKDYLFDNSAVYKGTLPKTPPNYGGTKAQRKIFKARVDAVKKPFEKQEQEKWEEYFDRFLVSAQKDTNLSCIDFVKTLATNIKPQYVEPWLLYTGETIDELMDVCSLHDAPGSVRSSVLGLREVYENSGLANAVQKIRAATSTDPITRQRRTIYHPDRPGGKQGHITKVGGIIRGNEIFVHLDITKL